MIGKDTLYVLKAVSDENKETRRLLKKVVEGIISTANHHPRVKARWYAVVNWNAIKDDIDAAESDCDLLGDMIGALGDMIGALRRWEDAP